MSATSGIASSLISPASWPRGVRRARPGSNFSWITGWATRLARSSASISAGVRSARCRSRSALIAAQSGWAGGVDGAGRATRATGASDAAEGSGVGGADAAPCGMAVSAAAGAAARSAMDPASGSEAAASSGGPVTTNSVGAVSLARSASAVDAGALAGAGFGCGVQRGACGLAGAAPSVGAAGAAPSRGNRRVNSVGDLLYDLAPSEHHFFRNNPRRAGFAFSAAAMSRLALTSIFASALPLPATGIGRPALAAAPAALAS